MLKISFFRRAQPRGFNYKPRYFDPEKEAREERKREILGEPAVAEPDAESVQEGPGDFIRRRGFRRNRMGISSRLAAKKKVSTIRSIIVLVLLAALLVWWFTSK